MVEGQTRDSDMIVTGATRVFAVIGDPIAHSLSPRIHNRWIQAHDLDAVYVALHLTNEHPTDAIRSLRASGLSGLNVTLPHKSSALTAASVQDESASSVGAANTLSADPSGGWIAHNTDVSGFAQAAEAALDAHLSGAKVVLIGAGGAARAAAFHLGKTGVELAILNRTRAKAQQLADEFAPEAKVAEMAELAAHTASADLVVNAASLGHTGGELPDLAPGGGRAFLDLSYGNAAAAVLARANDQGWTSHDGLKMLVAQAADAFRLWFSISPDQDSALAACRQEVSEATT